MGSVLLLFSQSKSIIVSEITQLVGYFKLPFEKGGSVHLFFRMGETVFHWCSAYAHTSNLEELRFGMGVKRFPQEPELELYQAKTWEEAKKWFN